MCIVSGKPLALSRCDSHKVCDYGKKSVLAEPSDPKKPFGANESVTSQPIKRTRTRSGGGDAGMGAALRSVYQKTVEESVPNEFLDLLGKLD